MTKPTIPHLASLLMFLAVSDGATCGHGSVGDGICADASQCCSNWGYCGSSDAYCADSAPSSQTSPTPSPINPSTTPPPPTTIESIDFPSFATGNCDNDDDVMTVNFGYYQSWAIYRSPDCNPVYPADIDVDGNGYTHLAYTFASISSTFELEPYNGDYFGEVERIEAFNAIKDDYPGLKTMIAVGGWSFNDAGSGTETRFSDTAATAESRETFATSVVQFLINYNFDGIDLDWEYPADWSRGGVAADKQNYALLVQAIRDAFNESGYPEFQITMAIPAITSKLTSGYDLESLSASLDFFNLMSYDTFGAWGSGNVQGANADMPYIFDTVEYMLNQNVPTDKIVLGLAGYGRTYTMASSSCTTMGCRFTGAGPGGCAGETGFMPYFTIDEYIQSGNYNSIQQVNPSTGAAELVINGNTLISYDSPESLNLKASFAAETCMRGYMWWAVDMIRDPIVLDTTSVSTHNPIPVGTSAPITLEPTPSPTPEPTSLSATPAPTLAPTEGSVTTPTETPATPAPTEETTDNSSGSLPIDEWILSTESRCGSSEADARGNCRTTCQHNGECAEGQYCWAVHSNFCGSKPSSSSSSEEECRSNSAAQSGFACGISELMARETCGTPCTNESQCNIAAGESCFALNFNYCHCADA